MNIQDFFHRRKFRVWPSFHAGYGRFGHSLYLLYIENIKRKYIDVIIIYRSTACLPSEPSVAFYDAGTLRIFPLVHHLSVYSVCEPASPISLREIIFPLHSKAVVCSLSVFLCVHLWLLWCSQLYFRRRPTNRKSAIQILKSF